MTKVQVNSQGKVYVANGKALIVTEGNEGSGTTDVPLTRISDDNGNEIGTWYMNFADANGNTYKVILLDSQYRNSSTIWGNIGSTVTNMPLYSDLKSSNIWEAGETATQNTQLILDYYPNSSACSHCRSKSFTIGGVTYYGQLPNMLEVFYIARNYNRFDAMDTSANSHSSLNFSSARFIWASNQMNKNSGWILMPFCTIAGGEKSLTNFACPVLEIPLN